MRADDGLDIWVYDSVGIDFRHVTVAPKEVDQTVGRFIELCSSPSSDKDEISTNPRRLYDWFIAPIESRISPARTLIIEADDPDRNLPFGAFQNHDGQYLASTLQIARVDSFHQSVSFTRRISILIERRAFICCEPVYRCVACL